jgi:hypothetical protein
MRIAILTIFVAACSGKARHTHEECPARAHELATWAEQARLDGPRVAQGIMSIWADVPLVDGPPPPLDLRFDRNRLELTATHTTYDDPPRDPEHPARILIAIDRSLPMRDVAPVIDRAARAGLIEASFLVQRHAAMKPPPPSSITETLDAIAADRDGSTKATRLARLLSDVVAPCPSLGKVFAAVTVVDDKAEAVVRGLEPAIVACACAADLDALRTGLWPLIGAGGDTVPTVITVTLAPADDPAATAITGTTWNDAAPALRAAAGTRVKLVAAP